MRMVQGIGVGGEWGGSVLLAMEWSRHHGQRGLLASWPQFGVPAGLFLANLSILAFSALSKDQFATWGWRVPFALSIILIGIGLWIRLGILETPVFQQLLDQDKIEKSPIVEVFRKQPREIILSALLRMGQQAPFYIFTAFIFAYAVGTLHMSRNLILSAVLVASCVSFVSIPLFGHMSDRIGRKKMHLIGAVATGLFGFLYFGMVDTAGHGEGPSCLIRFARNPPARIQADNSINRGDRAADMKGQHRSRMRKQHVASPKRPVRRALADPPDPPDVGGHTQRVFDPLMTADKGVETGMSFIITKAQKAELQRLGCREEQKRE